MIITSGHIEELPSVLFLSSKYYLKSYISSTWMVKKEYQDTLFIEHRRYRYDLPDYIHKNTIKELHNSLDTSLAPIRDTLLNSIKNISSYYIDFYENKPYITKGNFELWQNLITIQSPLLILSYSIYKYYQGYQSYENIVSNIFNYSTLPTTYNSFVDYLFDEKGASELHMHFNGTTESSLVWLDALQSPYKYNEDLKKSQNNSEVIELYKQFDLNFDASTLLKILLRAKAVREYLVEVVFTERFDSQSQAKWENYLDIQNSFSSESLFSYPYTNHPVEYFTNIKNELINESIMFINFFKYMDNNPNELFSKLLHFYILAQSFFQQLLIQQQNQYGFDQFQKITFNEIREPIEESFLKRFQQLETIYNKPLEYLEIRFAPKITYKKNKQLVSKIINDYKKYKKINHKAPRLVIVAHFIKIKDNYKELDDLNCLVPFRDCKLRSNLQKQVYAFLELIRNYPECREYIKGIDAAANELHASPEVFAPVFRYLKRHFTDAFLHEFELIESEKKINPMNLFMTYHAGEDYVHLLSGIRMVYEAVVFLDMPPKSRIGHATALGIEPGHWRRRIGKSLFIKQGEWFDNLLLFYTFIQKESKFTSLLNSIHNDMKYYYKKIYSYPLPDDLELLLAYHLRMIDPNILFEHKRKCETSNLINLIEFDYENLLKSLRNLPFINNIDMNDKTAIKLCKDYHTVEFYEPYNMLVKIDLNPLWDEAIFFVQQEMIKLLNQKEIAIETMPSSNLRISFYEHYKEHHIFNWFHPIKDINIKTQTPSLVLASDDPGIFANNLRTEYVHLYEAALELGANEQEIEEWLNILNENAKRFRF